MKNIIRAVITNIVVFLSLMFPVTIFGTNTIVVQDTEVAASNNCTVEIAVNNTDEFTAFQADIEIPEGFSYVENSEQLNAERASGHSISIGMVENTLRIIAYSASNTSFIGNSGILLSFSLKAGTVPGGYQLTPLNANLGNVNSQNILTSVQAGVVTVLSPDISVSTSGLNYSRVALTQSGTQYLTITNSGNQSLDVNSLAFSDKQFSSSDSSGFTLTPGSNKTIAVTFTPSQKGTFNKQLIINSNDPDEATITVNLTAIGYTINELHCGSISGASDSTLHLDLSINNMEDFYAFQFDLVLPSAMQFVEGDVTLFRNDDHQVQANMINEQVLRVVAFSASGSFFSGDDGKIISLGFLIDGDAGYYPLNLQNVVISNAQSENVTSDVYHGSLTVTSSDIYAANSLGFGDVSVLDTGSENLTVYNYGQESLIINEISFDNAFFFSNAELPVTIQPGNSQNLTINFSKQSKGSTTGKLNILSNDPDEYPFVVNLSGNAYEPNYITVDSLAVIQGDSLFVPVDISNNESFVAFQFDIEFPDGLNPNTESATLTSRKADHQLTVSQINDNMLRVIAWSGSISEFSGNEGAVVLLPFKVNAEMPTGNYPLALSNGVLSSTAYEDILYGVESGVLTVDSSMSSVPVDFSLNDYVLLNNQTECFNAQNQIVISGNDPVTFEPGSNATLIAGHSIRFLPGFHAQSGSYMDAHITTTGSFCEDLPAPMMAAEPVAEKKMEFISSVNDEELKKQEMVVYPNPNNGHFTIKLKNIDSETRVLMYNSVGQKVYDVNMTEKSLSVELPDLQRGIYFIKAINNQKQFDQKIVVQ